MIDFLPPGLILILGGLLISLLRGRAQAIAAVVLPVLGFAQLLMLEAPAEPPEPGQSAHDGTRCRLSDTAVEKEFVGHPVEGRRLPHLREAFQQGIVRREPMRRIAVVQSDGG